MVNGFGGRDLPLAVTLCYSFHMQEFTLNEAQKNLAELVDEALSGQEIVIRKDADASVQLTAVSNSGHPQFGSAENLIEIGADFDAPLPEFEPFS